MTCKFCNRKNHTHLTHICSKCFRRNHPSATFRQGCHCGKCVGHECNRCRICGDLKHATKHHMCAACFATTHYHAGPECKKCVGHDCRVPSCTICFQYGHVQESHVCTKCLADNAGAYTTAAKQDCMGHDCFRSVCGICHVQGHMTTRHLCQGCGEREHDTYFHSVWLQLSTLKLNYVKTPQLAMAAEALEYFQPLLMSLIQDTGSVATIISYMGLDGTHILCRLCWRLTFSGHRHCTVCFSITHTERSHHCDVCHVDGHEAQQEHGECKGCRMPYLQGFPHPFHIACEVCTLWRPAASYDAHLTKCRQQLRELKLMEEERELQRQREEEELQLRRMETQREAERVQLRRMETQREAERVRFRRQQEEKRAAQFSDMRQKQLDTVKRRHPWMQTGFELDEDKMFRRMLQRHTDAFLRDTYPSAANGLISKLYVSHAKEKRREELRK